MIINDEYKALFYKVREILEPQMKHLNELDSVFDMVYDFTEIVMPYCPKGMDIMEYKTLAMKAYSSLKE